MKTLIIAVIVIAIILVLIIIASVAIIHQRNKEIDRLFSDIQEIKNYLNIE